MSYYETDPSALEWYRCALTHPSHYVRISALILLADVDCVHRRSWLSAAQRDSVPEVAATAVLIEAVASVSRRDQGLDLFESSFGDSIERADLDWEWEYEIAVPHGPVVHPGRHRVWTRAEDDRLARSIALRRAYSGKEREMAQGTPLIVRKRLVNQYTRSPRSSAEAVMWLRRGRPRYSE